MSDVNKVKDNGGIFYGFQDDVARQRLDSVESSIVELRSDMEDAGKSYSLEKVEISARNPIAGYYRIELRENGTTRRGTRFTVTKTATKDSNAIISSAGLYEYICQEIVVLDITPPPGQGSISTLIPQENKIHRVVGLSDRAGVIISLNFPYLNLASILKYHVVFEIGDTLPDISIQTGIVQYTYELDDDVHIVEDVRMPSGFTGFETNTFYEIEFKYIRGAFYADIKSSDTSSS